MIESYLLADPRASRRERIHTGSNHKPNSKTINAPPTFTRLNA
jgi:hypothetical protein